jgi:hypothetical protein
MKSHLFGGALLSVIAIVATVPAHAQNGSLTRSFVSSSGVDTNACTITAPCATFAVAYTKISANGIIAALDPGKYGPITITGPVTINGNGWSAITGPAGNNAITINAPSGAVNLTGLEIDGAGASYNGIVFNSGGSLSVNNSIVQGFVQDSGLDANTGNGILIQPTSVAAGSTVVPFDIENTTVAGNAYAGILYAPPSGSFKGLGVIDHVNATGDQYGISVNMVQATGGVGVVTVSDSTASNNFQDGIFATNTGSPGAISLTVENTYSINNIYGVYLTGSPEVLLGRNTITHNLDYGVYNPSSSLVYSFGNNDISFDGTVSGSCSCFLNTPTVLSPK